MQVWKNNISRYDVITKTHFEYIMIRAEHVSCYIQDVIHFSTISVKWWKKITWSYLTWIFIAVHNVCYKLCFNTMLQY